MKNRYMPYGYMIQDGQYVVNAAEAEAVRDAFRLYAGGHSYLAIAGMLNKGNYPAYSADGWNKHHIKQILENSRYMGDVQYPAILTAEQFAAARTIHDKKVSGRKHRDNSANIVWERLVCNECGGRMHRTGGRLVAKGILQLRCKNTDCTHNIDIAEDILFKTIACLQNKILEAPAENIPCEYRPAPEVLRMDSQISRAITKLDDPAEAVRLILQGIDARYNAIPALPELPHKKKYDDRNRLLEPDWALFKEAVSHISFSQAGIGLKTIHGQEYFTERNDEHAGNNATSKGSNRHTRQPAVE